MGQETALEKYLTVMCLDFKEHDIGLYCFVTFWIVIAQKCDYRSPQEILLFEEEKTKFLES